MTVTQRAYYGATDISIPLDEQEMGKRVFGNIEEVSKVLQTDAQTISHYRISATKYESLNKNSKIVTIVGLIVLLCGFAGALVGLFTQSYQSLGMSIGNVGAGAIMLGRGLGQSMAMADLEKIN
jgi:hypothetical protein